MPNRKTLKSRPMPPSPLAKVFPKELKIALLAAIPFGITAALIANWSSLFPVPPEKFVEVVWRHQCSCVKNWMKTLRAEGFVVRDFELENIDTFRGRWKIPDSIRGCHPARYMGYFIDGHATAENLRRLAQEHPTGIGLLVKEKALEPASLFGQSTKQNLVLIDKAGAQTPWP